MIIAQPDRIILQRQIATFAPRLMGSLLDVGAGRSRRYQKICTQVTQYTTMDIDEKGGPDVVGSIEAMPFPDAHFDSILCTQVLEHVPHPHIAMKEISRVLKSGGYCLLTVPQWNEMHEVPHDYFRYTNFGLQTLFNDNGFDVEVMDQRGKYHALRAQLRIRYWIDRFHPYENKTAMLILGPLSLLLAKWAMWRDARTSSPAAKLHVIGWCVLAKKR